MCVLYIDVRYMKKSTLDSRGFRYIGVPEVKTVNVLKKLAELVGNSECVLVRLDSRNKIHSVPPYAPFKGANLGRDGKSSWTGLENGYSVKGEDAYDPCLQVYMKQMVSRD